MATVSIMCPCGAIKVAEFVLDTCNALTCIPLVCGCQIVGPRRGQHRLQALGEVLTLLESQAHARIQLLELCVDTWQQRVVVLLAQPDDVIKGVESGLPG